MPPSPSEWRRGWPVVLAAAIGIGTGPGLFQNLSSLFIPGLIAEFGWTRGQIGTAAALGLLASIATPFLGRLVDRFGARPMIVSAMLLLAATYLGMTAMAGPLWQYQALIALLALTVPGTSGVVYAKLIAARFVAHRGLALGLATSGLSVTTLAMPPLIGAAIASEGWRAGFVTLAGIVALLALPAVLIALRGAPAGPTRPAPDEADATPVEGLTGAEARRDGRFWRLAIAVALINFGSVGLVTSLVPFGLDRGLGEAQAAALLASFGASQMVGRLAIGWLIDRYRPQTMAALFALASAAAFAVLAGGASSFALLMVAVFFAGLMNAAEQDLLPYFGVRLFGLRAFGEVYGTVLVIALAGTASGIAGFGRLHDATGGYTVALTIAAAALVGSALLFRTLTDRELPAAQVIAASYD
ncbi:MFS transporter [Sphingomonas sp.]|uniref:MFS transporter n=1 Tax=Sphingomonas sp. TaxID=28214 RepID=UPI0035C82BF4